MVESRRQELPERRTPVRLPSSFASSTRPPAAIWANAIQNADITSALAPIAADLIAGISTSMIEKEPSAAGPPASDRVIPPGRQAERNF